LGSSGIPGTVEVSRAAETTDTALKPLTQKRVHAVGVGFNESEREIRACCHESLV